MFLCVCVCVGACRGVRRARMAQRYLITGPSGQAFWEQRAQMKRIWPPWRRLSAPPLQSAWADAFADACHPPPSVTPPAKPQPFYLPGCHHTPSLWPIWDWICSIKQAVSLFPLLFSLLSSLSIVPALSCKDNICVFAGDLDGIPQCF